MYRFITITLMGFFLFISSGCSQEEAPTISSQAVEQAAAVAEKEPATAEAKKTKAAGTLERWQPSFDPSGAQHTYLLSCIGHPDIEGVAVGFNIRDEVWKRSNGRLFVDYRPLAQLGGEKDVLSKLRMGAVQGMLSSSVAAANLDDRLGLVNLPFLIDTPNKLEEFRNDSELFSAFGAPLLDKGIMVADFTGYGAYGWASRTPVRTIEEAKGVNFRIAQAPVNTELYKTWGMKFTVMPWPDVPQALQTGVIDGLDHTPIVCSISRKFDNVKNFTFLNYAQGLYVHLINLKWLNNLPEDLKQILLNVVTEQSAISRQATQDQETREIEQAKSRSVQFWSLDDGEREKLATMAKPIYDKWAAKIGADYLNKVKNKFAPATEVAATAPAVVAAAATVSQEVSAKIEEQAAAVAEKASATVAKSAVPEEIILTASYGNITFPHSMHAESGDCAVCHGTAPPEELAITKEVAHKLCKGCHKDQGAGPTSCKGCHKK